MDKPRIGEILLKSGLVSETDLEKALEAQAGTGKLLGEILVDMGLVGKHDLWLAWQNQVVQKPEAIYGINVSEKVSELALGNLAAVYNVIPLHEKDDSLTVVMMRGQDVTVIDDMRVFLDKDITSVIAANSTVVEAMRKYHSDIKLRCCDRCGEVLADPDTIVSFNSKDNELEILCKKCFPQKDKRIG